MTMDKILIAIAAFFLEVFIYWFFFGKKYTYIKTVKGRRSIGILVNGGYKPENIKIKKGETTKLIFERKDRNTCLEEIVIPDFKIKKYLPLNKKVEIILTPQETGIFQTHCGMGMFHGKIIVE